MSEPIPSSKGVVATAGKEPMRLTLDFNRDGIDDLEQLRAQLAKGQPIAETVLRIVAVFVPQHTTVGRWLAAYFEQWKPKVDEFVGGGK